MKQPTGLIKFGLLDDSLSLSQRKTGNNFKKVDEINIYNIRK